MIKIQNSDFQKKRAIMQSNCHDAMKNGLINYMHLFIKHTSLIRRLMFQYLNKFVEIRATKYIDIKKVLQAQFAI